MTSLTPRERREVRRLTEALRARIAKAGLTLTREPMPNLGEYDDASRTIALTTKRRPPLETLFTLAHEYGHYESHEAHRTVGRTLGAFTADDALFEEVRAWRYATLALDRMRGRRLWAALQAQMSLAITENATDFEAAFWLTDRVRRARVSCTRCRSPDLVVLGAESQGDCQIACRRCPAHTRLRRTMEAVAKHHLRGRRLVGLCRCGAPPLGPRAMTTCEKETTR